MSSYQIKPYSYEQAERIGVIIKPSHNKDKKIDVYKDNEFICSIGDINYNDYPTYLKTKGKAYASERRRLYHSRHRKENVPNTKAWYSKTILW